MDRVVGVLGGMGPAATVAFFNELVALTPASKDQDHLRIVIDNNPKLPDRTESILSGDKSLVPLLIDTAKNLQRAGADFLAIPCNTVHYFYDALATEISVPVLHMIREVIDAVSDLVPDCRRIGLLATTGTIVSGIYATECQKVGIELIVPRAEEQDSVMEAISQIKRAGVDGRVKTTILKQGHGLIAREAQALILGCTELALTVNSNDCSMLPVVDSLRVLAKATVRFAQAE